MSSFLKYLQEEDAVSNTAASVATPGFGKDNPEKELRLKKRNPEDEKEAQ